MPISQRAPRAKSVTANPNQAGCKSISVASAAIAIRSLVLMAAILQTNTLPLVAQGHLQNSPNNHMAADVDSVLCKYHEVIGGIQKLREIETLSLRGKSTFDEAEVFDVLILKAKAGKVRIGYQPDANSRSVSMLSVCDGRKSWTFQAPDHATLDPESTAKVAPVVLGLFPFVNDTKLKKQLVYKGVVEFDGKVCHALKFTSTEDGDVHFYFDPESAFLVGTAFDADGKHHVIQHSEYKELGGVKFPTTERWAQGNDSLIRTEYTEIGINAELPKDAFEMPDELKQQIELVPKD